jgi:hypothetical protein
MGLCLEPLQIAFRPNAHGARPSRATLNTSRSEPAEFARLDQNSAHPSASLACAVLLLEDMTSFREIAALAAFVSSLTACGPASSVPPTLDGTEPPQRADEAGQLVTVDGEVIGVDRASLGDQLATGVRVSIGTDRSSPLQIQLAPGWYLDERGLRLAEHERIRVLGMPIRTGRTTVVAWEVRTGAETYRLRDARGRPLWKLKAR